MPSPFSQTLESRRIDLFARWQLVLAVALVLGVLWTQWLLLAPIVEVEPSQTVVVTDQRSHVTLLEHEGNVRLVRHRRTQRIVASFAAQALARIEVGQHGRLVFNAGSDAPGDVVPVTVVEVGEPGSADGEEGDEGAGVVLLDADFPADQRSLLDPGPGGVVVIDVVDTTPAGILGEAAGLTATSRAVSRGPAPWAP
ncbi:MAG: hypothetical protein AAGF11_16865 [Myxococcota bacterium]